MQSSKRIARRDKKAFLSDQCKEMEENNKMPKTRDLFKKIQDTKGTFHPKMDSIKDRNGMDLTEAEDIKKRWQEEIRKPSLVISAKKEENNRIGKIRDLFKKIQDTKGTFHAKMGSIKDSNGMDLTEAEDIKKRWQKNYTKKIFTAKIIMMV